MKTKIIASTGLLYLTCVLMSCNTPLPTTIGECITAAKKKGGISLCTKCCTRLFPNDTTTEADCARQCGTAFAMVTTDPSTTVSMTSSTSTTSPTTTSATTSTTATFVDSCYFSVLSACGSPTVDPNSPCLAGVPQECASLL